MVNSIEILKQWSYWHMVIYQVLLLKHIPACHRKANFQDKICLSKEMNRVKRYKSGYMLTKSYFSVDKMINPKLPIPNAAQHGSKRYSRHEKSIDEAIQALEKAKSSRIHQVRLDV